MSSDSLGPEAEWEPLDGAYRAYAASTEAPPWGSLLAQTLLTATERRNLLRALGVGGGWSCLDLGTGFGPIPLELAHLAPVRAVGVDVDEALLEAAGRVADALAPTSFLRPGSTVELQKGDACALEFDDGRFDLVTARLLFQHLERPELAAGEIRRVLRSGGLALLYDVDDGLSCSWPEPTSAVAALDRAYAALQAARGGDRVVGRKLSGYLAVAGLEILRTLALSHAAHEPAGASDSSVEVTIARHLDARDALCGSGLIDEATFEQALGELRSAPPVDRFRVETRVAVVGRLR